MSKKREREKERERGSVDCVQCETGDRTFYYFPIGQCEKRANMKAFVKFLFFIFFVQACRHKKQQQKNPLSLFLTLVSQLAQRFMGERERERESMRHSLYEHP